jgi:hypothetical protein
MAYGYRCIDRKEPVDRSNNQSVNQPLIAMPRCNALQYDGIASIQPLTLNVLLLHTYICNKQENTQVGDGSFISLGALFGSVVGHYVVQM